MQRHLEASIDPPPPPEEYDEFLMCLAFGRFPHELDELDNEKYVQFREFLRLERAAGRLKSLQSSFYS